jgi:hypothetical protein
MGSTERTILERVQTNCQAIDGSGSYNYDFSDTDAVILGMEPAATAPRSPGIYIFTVNLDSRRIKGKTPLNSYTRVFVIQVDCWVPRTSEAAGVGMLSAVDASSDVMRVLENDPTCGGVTHDLEINALTYDGEQIQIPGYGVASLRVQYEYNEKRGT